MLSLKACHIFLCSGIGCQVQSFWSFIKLLCISDIWLACWLLVFSWVSHLIPTWSFLMHHPGTADKLDACKMFDRVPHMNVLLAL